MMRILFYLPIVTPWWLDTLVINLVRSLSICAEIHIVIGLAWKNTGLMPDQLDKYKDLQNVQWHLYTGSDQESFRTNAADQQELIDFIVNLNADITICRSAEIEVVKHFPGHVRYFTEADFDPLLKLRNSVFQTHIFEYGLMPSLTESERDWLSENFAPFWEDMVENAALQKTMVDRKTSGLPVNSPVIALPLEYRHEENFFSHLSQYETQSQLISEILSCMPDNFTLAISDHPLNHLYRPRDEMQNIVGENHDRVVLVPGQAQGGLSTFDLIGLSDGVVLENSKCISAAAFHGTPICRLSSFRQASWLNCYSTLESLFQSIKHQEAKAPEKDSCRNWLGYHVANNVIGPEELAGDPLNILGYLLKPHDPSRWPLGIERYRTHWNDRRLAANKASC